MLEQGPREQAVRATLNDRPAGIIYSASRRAQRCFAGFFNGALSRGHVTPSGGLFIGKAECEWDWQNTWAELKTLGLIEWTDEHRPNHPDIGGTSHYVHVSITDKGREVRADDLKWFNELMDAKRADDPA
jgi:hypothetical protein